MPGRLLSDAFRDLRHTARTLARSAVPSVAAILALGLGLGATTTVFSVVEGVLLSPLPYPEPERLVVLWEAQQERGLSERRVAPAEVVDLRNSKIFESVCAWAPAKLALTGSGEPLEVHALRVTPNFFATLGIQVAEGRGFRDEEATPGRSDVVILSDGLWRQRFGADPAVLGKTMTLDGRPFEVIGVASKRVGPFSRGDFWIPLALDTWQSRVARFLHVIARLPKGRSFEAARAGIQRLSAALASEHPETDRGWSLRIVGAKDQLVSEARPTLWVLFAAVVLVLGIACANVATLLLARGVARSRELAIRKTLGAGRGALARLVVLEAISLAVVSGALGVLLAAWGVKIVLALAPRELPGLENVSVHLGTVAFAVAAAVLAGLLSAVWPALQSWRIEVRAALQPVPSGSGGRGWRAASFGRLVSVQIALALLLLVGTGLMLESFLRLQHVDLGFAPRGLVAAPLTLPRNAYGRGADIAGFYQRVLDRLGRNPAVAARAATSKLPLSGETASFRFAIEGEPPRPSAEQPTADYEVVSPGYFRTMHIPLVLGRNLAEAWSPGAPGILVINRAMARRYWPEQPFGPDHPGAEGPVGKRISVEGPSGPWLTIVGIVEDVRRNGPAASAAPAFYAPFGQDPWPSMTVVVRGASEQADLGAAIKDAVWASDPDLPVPQIFKVEDRLSELVARPRFLLVLLTVFGIAAVLLASVGLYGVMAYTVGLKRSEIAIRMSLGAERRAVIRGVLADAMKLVAVGIGVGLVASLATTRLLKSLLFGVGGTEPVVFGAVAVLLAATALVATALPAIRASHVNPAEILKG